MRCAHCLEEITHAVDTEYMHPFDRQSLVKYYQEPGSCWRNYAAEVYEEEITVIVDVDSMTRNFASLLKMGDDED